MREKAPASRQQCVRVEVKEAIPTTTYRLAAKPGVVALRCAAEVVKVPERALKRVRGVVVA